MNSNWNRLGFSAISADEAEWLNNEVLHCGHVSAGDIWPFDPDRTDVLELWPDLTTSTERVLAIEISVQVLEQYRARGYASEGALDEARYIWACCCRG
jgi:hypothetical protein